MQHSSIHHCTYSVLSSIVQSFTFWIAVNDVVKDVAASCRDVDSDDDGGSLW